MADDAMQKIEALTPSDYVGALTRSNPTEGQWEMLRIHLAAPDRMISARHLARAIGFSDWHGANLHYGKFAGKLCKELGVSPSTNLSALVEFFKTPGNNRGQTTVSMANSDSV